MGRDDAKSVADMVRRTADNVAGGDADDPEAIFLCETADLIEQQAAEIERLTIRWSDGRPKVAGLHFVRVKPCPGLWDSQWIEEWSEQDVAGGRMWFAGHQHAGPIIIHELEAK
jgi:hypothetical protein